MILPIQLGRLDTHGTRFSLGRLINECRNEICRPSSISPGQKEGTQRYIAALLTSTLVAGARAASVFLSFLSIPLAIRHLGVREYGVWMVITSLMTVFNLADLGIGNGLLNAIARADADGDRYRARESFSSAIALSCVSCGAILLVVAIGYPFLPLLIGGSRAQPPSANDTATAVAAFIAFIAVSMPFGMVQKVQQGLQRGYYVACCQALGALLSFVGILIAITIRGNLVTFVTLSSAGQLLSLMVNSAAYLRMVNPQLIPSLRYVSWRSVKSLTGAGMRLFSCQVGAAATLAAPAILLQAWRGPEAVAEFTIAQKFFSLIIILNSLVIAPLWPAYAEAHARNDLRWVRSAFKYSMVWTLVISVLPVIAGMALSGPIVRLFGAKLLAVNAWLFASTAALTVITALRGTVSVLANGTGRLAFTSWMFPLSGLGALCLAPRISFSLSAPIAPLVVMAAEVLILAAMVFDLRFLLFHNSALC